MVVEGLDRSGKSSQCQRLLRQLQADGAAAEGVKFPDRTTPIGRMIDAYLHSRSDLDDRAIHLLFSANRWELASAMRAKIEAGVTLVVDRYVYSGAAFSCAKGLPLEWCMSCDVGLPRPDLVLFLDISEHAAAARASYGEERYETLDLQRKVASVFARVRNTSRESWQAVDASLDMDTVTQCTLAAVRNAMGRVRGPMGALT